MNSFNIYALIAVGNAFAAFAIGFFVFLQNRQAKANSTFFLLTITVTIWSTAYYAWQIANDAVSALFWSRYLMAGAIFIPIVYIHFILAFLGKTKKNKKSLLLSYLIFFSFFLFNFTSYFVNRVEPMLSFKYWPKPGPVFHLFLILWVAYALYGMYLLSVAYKTSKGIKKIRIRYLIGGIILGYVGGSTNYFLWYGIPLPPIANFFVILQLLAIAVAILKYRLLNIKIIATEFLVGLISLILLINIFTYESGLELITKIVIFIATTVFGIRLIKSVVHEIDQKEKTQKLAIALKEANKKLKKLDETKSEFISIASHQLRTPLSAVKGYAAMLLEETKDPEKKDALNKIFLSNERLIKLVNDLLNLSRIERGKLQFNFKEKQLADILSSVVAELQMLATRRGLKIIYNRVDLPLLKIDGDKLRQVFVNIIDNAIKYTLKGKIVIKTYIDDNSVTVAIHDTGVGMKQEDIDSIYEKFQRGETGRDINPSGAGIGLYIAHKIVGAHNGHIWAESKGINQGSTFYIKLPLSG